MKKILFLILIIPHLAWASLELGVGMNSTHSGRVVPTLSTAFVGSNWALSAWTSGVKNQYYYQSSYGLNWYALARVGDMLGGPVVFGAGLGLYHGKKSFKDVNDPEIKKDDFAFGPSIRINWTFAPHMYLNFDATYGLRDLGSHLFLNFQDVISTSIGVRLW